MTSYHDIAADLRRRIAQGELTAGDALPTIAELAELHGVAKGTANAAITVLANEGLVTAGRGRGATVRDRHAIRIPLSRYRAVLRPGRQNGPWETATRAQNLDGSMKLIGTAEIAADEDQAGTFGLPIGTTLIYRRRHAMIGKEVVQIQQAWYPADLVNGTPLAGPNKVIGGAYAALTEVGHPPKSASEHITVMRPSNDEAAQLRISVNLPVLHIKRVTHGRDHLVLELAHIITPADRAELVYDDLPLTRN